MISSRIIPGMHFAVSLYGLYQVVSYFQISPMHIAGVILLPIAAFCFFSAMVQPVKISYKFELAGITCILGVIGFIAWNFSVVLGIFYTASMVLNAALMIWRVRSINKAKRR